MLVVLVDSSESPRSQCFGKGRSPSGSMRVFSLQLQLPICNINWFHLRLGNHWYQRSLNVISYSQYSAFLYHLASSLCYFSSAYRLVKPEEYSPRLSSWWIVSICQEKMADAPTDWLTDNVWIIIFSIFKQLSPTETLRRSTDSSSVSMRSITLKEQYSKGNFIFTQIVFHES